MIDRVAINLHPMLARTAAVIAISCVMLASASAAEAHTASYPTTINYTGTTSPPLTFSGFLTSKKDSCLRNRKLNLVHDGTRVGTTNTDTRGYFQVVSSTDANGTYTIRVLRRVYRTSYHEHICKTADFDVVY